MLRVEEEINIAKTILTAKCALFKLGDKTISRLIVDLFACLARKKDSPRYCGDCFLRHTLTGIGRKTYEDLVCHSNHLSVCSPNYRTISRIALAELFMAEINRRKEQQSG